MNQKTTTASLIGMSLSLMLLMGACSETLKTEEASADTKMATPPPTIPMKDFFKNQERKSYNISPNGEFYAFLAPYEDRMNIHVQKIGEDEAKRVTSIVDRDLAGFYWANDDRLLYMKDTGGDENYTIYGVNKDGSNLIALTDTAGVMASIIDELDGLDDHIMITLNKRNPQIFDPYRLNITNGEMEMVAENPGNISGWITDHEGKIRMATTTDGTSTSLMYRETEEDEFETVLTTNFKESASPLFFTFDNKNIYASSNIGRDKSAIVLMDPRTGEELEMLYEHPQVDVGSLNYSEKRKVLTTIYFTTDRTHREYLDDEIKGMYMDLEEKLPGYEVYINGFNDDEDKCIVRTYSDRSLGAIYFYDAKTKELRMIQEMSDWLNEDQMAEMKPITYKSRDGLTINGYLTLPVGREAKNLPVVVNPHGGPWARDRWGFNPEIQFLANRGYAVLQMNFRGSTGYGREFWEASFHQWGQAMQDDVTDGVKWLVDEGIADAERVAIYGGSYGGYCTLAGLTFTPDLYACGVDYVGVSNIFTWMSGIPPYWEPYREMIYEMVGDPVKDSVMIAAASPALNADKITAPLFVAQGANDQRVPKVESDQMVEALKANGVDVEYLVKDDEGHGFHNEENRFDFYGAMEKFLDKYIGEGSKTEALEAS